jgi:hypothetical protein
LDRERKTLSGWFPVGICIGKRKVLTTEQRSIPIQNEEEISKKNKKKR